jgi:glycerophosphoryl diester phosphodiesterase
MGIQGDQLLLRREAMSYFEIVGHRGVPTELPENTIPSFQRAVDLGADAIELDVRLTHEGVPVVYHYFYLDAVTTMSGTIFDYTFDQLRDAEILGPDGKVVKGCGIPTLHEVLEIFGGRIGFEIEVKGPEPELPEIVAALLHNYKHLWDTIEVTSYEPALLLDIGQRCPGLVTDVLLPRSEDWMGLDVIAYLAIHRARLARARAVHLHTSQLSPDVVSAVRSSGIEVHSWDVNDEEALNQVVQLGIPRIDTDEVRRALEFRRRDESRLRKDR